MANFFSAHHRPPQQQTRHVDAGDEQDKTNRAGKHPKRAPYIAHGFLEQRHELESEMEITVRITQVSLDNRPGHRLHVGPSLSQRQIRFDPSKHQVTVTAAVIWAQVVRSEGERLPHFGVQRIVKSLRQHAYDHHRPAVDRKLSPDNGRVAAEASLPKPVAEQENLVMPGLALLRQKNAARDRLETEDGKQVR